MSIKEWIRIGIGLVEDGEVTLRDISEGYDSIHTVTAMNSDLTDSESKSYYVNEDIIQTKVLEHFGG